MRAAVAGICLVMLHSAGCSREEEAPASRRAGFIAVVGAGDGDPIWPVLRSTAAEHTADWDIPVRITAPRLVSSGAQIDLIQALASDGMKALCVQVVDAGAARRLLESLRRRGVTVATMVREVPVSPPFHHVGWNEHALGERLADALAEALFGEGAGGESPITTMKEVVLIVPPERRPGDDSGNDSAGRGPDGLRDQGFRRRFERSSAIRVLDELTCHRGAELPALICASALRFPTLSGWVLLESWAVGEAPPDVAVLTRDRVIAVPNPLPAIWPLTRCEARVVAVAPDYAAIAPAALDYAFGSLRGGMSHRDTTEVDLGIITERDWEEYRARFEAWQKPPPEPAKPSRGD